LTTSENRLKILCFVDRASQYVRVTNTNSMHCLSSVRFVSQPLHILGIFVAHHQGVYYKPYILDSNPH